MSESILLSLILLVAGLSAALVCLCYALAPMKRTGRLAADVENENESDDAACTEADASGMPSVTVVVFARCDEERLKEYLAQLEAQDYPARSTVVVYDASAEVTSAMAEEFAKIFPDVYFTFIPPESHNLSRRKLALTIGIKAAKGKYVLTTSADCDIPSPRWLSLMMKPVLNSDRRNGRNNVEVVLGSAHPGFAEMRGAAKWYRQYLDVCTTSMWAGYALAGHPYRGDGLNLLFARRLFFDHNGYAATAHLHTGDDDLFVNDIADGPNTRVVLDRRATLTARWGDSTNRVLTHRREHYAFTARLLPHAPARRDAACSLMHWCVPALLAAAGIVAWPSWWPAAAALALLLTFYGLETIIYRRAAKALGAVRLWWSVPLFMTWRPLGNLIFSLRHRSLRASNYTYGR